MKHNQAISLLVNATYSLAWQRNQKLEEARQMSIDALEKQQPMKPGHDELSIDGRIIIPCGNCGEELKTVMWEYCPWCGQKIEWVEESGLKENE